MVTHKYTQSVPLGVAIANRSRDIMTQMLAKQTEIVNSAYKRRKAPHLGDSLTPSIMTVDPDPNRMSIEIDYPATIRFLDLKKVGLKYDIPEGKRKGSKAFMMKKKRYHTPVYMRITRGYLYGSGYSLTNAINVLVFNEVKRMFDDIKNEFSNLEL